MTPLLRGKSNRPENRMGGVWAGSETESSHGPSFAPAGGVSLSKQTLGSSGHQAPPEGTEESGSAGFRRDGWVGLGWEIPPNREGSCRLCHGEFVVPVGPPDEFGNVDFDDCDCVKP